MRVGYNVDSFGHNAGLPQILSKAGIDYYIFMRPNPREKELPDSMFHWAGPDGSRVLAFRLHETYGTNNWEIPAHVAKCVENRPKNTTVTACFYGVVFGTLEQMFEHTGPRPKKVFVDYLPPLGYRLYETSAKPTKATLSLMGTDYPVEMGPFELKTLKIAEGKAVEVDLIERT